MLLWLDVACLATPRPVACGRAKRERKRSVPQASCTMSSGIPPCATEGWNHRHTRGLSISRLRNESLSLRSCEVVPPDRFSQNFGNLSRWIVCIDLRLGERLQVSKITLEVYCVGARRVGKIRVSRREIGNIVVNKYACRFAWVFKCCRDDWSDQSKGSSLMSIHANNVLPFALPKLNKESQYAYSWMH